MTKRAKTLSKSKTGRPLAKIDPKVVEGMANVGATDQEIADFVGYERSTVTKRFSQILRKARSGMRIKLRQAQLKLAFGTPTTTRTTVAPDGTKIVEVTEGYAPNPTMNVWLGKQMLDQQDKMEHSGPDGGPIAITVVRRIVRPK